MLPGWSAATRRRVHRIAGRTAGGEGVVYQPILGGRSQDLRARARETTISSSYTAVVFL